MKSRRFISIFLCVTLLLTLPAPAALANGWGLKRGLMLNAVSKTHDYDEYSALAQLKVQDGEVAVMASRYHAVLLFAYEFNGKTRLDAYHTAVLQPDEKGYKKVKLQRRDPGFVLQYSDMELYFTPLLSNEALTYVLESGALGSLTLQAGGENSELTSYLTVSDGKNSVKWYGWQHATPSLAEFNLRLFPRTMDELGAMRELINVVAPQFVDYELYSADEMPGDAGAATVPVYSAPGDGSVRFAKGKASVNLREPAKFYGFTQDGNWALVEYTVSGRTSRFGYVRRSELPSSVTWKYNISSIDMPVTVTQDTFLTDDPNVSQYRQMTLKAGGSVRLLALYGPWYAYVETTLEGLTVRGFVPLPALPPAHRGGSRGGAAAAGRVAMQRRRRDAGGLCHLPAGRARRDQRPAAGENEDAFAPGAGGIRRACMGKLSGLQIHRARARELLERVRAYPGLPR